MELQRDNLTRSVPFKLERATDDGDGLTLEGYGAVFDSPTRIDSWEGQFDEVIARGAFKKTLRERTPVLMFDHGQHPLVGSMPLGRIEAAREDSQGLYVKARLSDNWLVKPVRDAIAEGSISGMSFRFSVVKESWTERGKNVPLRTLQEVKAPELGPVVFPAYRDTSVGVRDEGFTHYFLAEMARVGKTFGTARGADLSEVTPDAAAASTTEPAPATPRIPLSERRKRALQIRGVIQ